ncbi:uncharacterized protein LOC116214091 [Punica granatum]|uniref:Uncharacterized protein LOC116214091 n=1 Tax=Punica granatum TaxID=22663 RepID=A0A218WCW3_PUNGR|nr:uncharacterized protein LOC116214091 [Punica granatum]OWM70655.1 hypothetical protein CDL15_Pgr014328 [Punica granatum]
MEKVLPKKNAHPGEGLEDSEIKGVSSLLKMREGWREDAADGKAEGLGFVLRGIDMNREDNGDKKQEADEGLPDGASVSIGASGLGSKGDLGVNGNVSAENGGGQDVETGKLGFESKNEEGDLVGLEEYKYSVGDFVWGKIKSHPWWPGRVYDSSVASEYAAKLRQEGKLLVAYFGDGTFAWCHPSQLRSFEENFEEMVKQSSSKAFLHSVKEAVEEIGRLVNSKMTCPCVRGTEQNGPFVVNSGVKEGVLLPDEGIGKLEVASIEPTDLLTILRHKAQVADVACGIELGILKGWILGYYRAKAGFRYELPVCVEPEPIPGLEDRRDGGRNGREDGGNGVMGVLSRGPVEEEKEGEKHGASENGTQRKQKSIAEILGSGPHSKDKVGQRKRKMTNLLESSPVMHSGGSGREGKQEKKKRGRKKKTATPGGESDGGGVEESEQQKDKTGDETGAKGSGEKGYVSRERKKSKYLSPPYLNLNKGDKKGDIMAESLRVSGIVRLGERLSNAAENLVVPQEKFSPKSPRKVQTELKTLSSQTPKQVQGETSEQMELKASAKEVLSKVHSLARDPQRRMSLDAVEGFLQNFRSSVYNDYSMSDVKSKGKTGRKRKSQDQIQSDLGSSKVRSQGRPKKIVGPAVDTSKLHSVPILYNEKGQAPAALPSPGTKLKRKRSKKTKESELDTPDAKKTKSESKPLNQKKGETGANLVVSFGPGSSLPTKEDLIRIFRKFGLLNEGETNMYYNNFCGIIAFEKTSDAELALDSSRKASPFGSASVKFEVKPPSPKKPKKGLSSQSKKQKRPASASAPKSEASEVEVIKERLQMVTSMLDKSNGKLSKKMRARLEGELKGVLEKVSAGGGSSSSA